MSIYRDRSEMYRPVSVGTPPTETQARVYRFLLLTVAKEGRLPSIREICTHFGFLSPNGAYCHLRAIAKLGLIQIRRHRSRSIELCGVFWQPQFEDSDIGKLAQAIFEAK